MKIGTKLFSVIALLTTVSVLIAGGVSFFLTKELIEAKLEDQLSSTAVSKADRFNDFITEQVEDLQGLADSLFLRTEFKGMRTAGKSIDQYLLHERKINTFFSTRMEEQKGFSEFSILDLNGIVVASTNANAISKSKEEEEYFKYGKKTVFVQSFYFDKELREPTVTIATPLRDEEYTVIGVLAGRVNLDEVSKLMQQRLGLGETGETYLVDKQRFAVTDLRKIKDAALKTRMNSSIVKECFKKRNERPVLVEDFKDYHKDSATGVYVYISEREVCLIAKEDQQEAFAPIVNLGVSLFLAVLVIILLTLFITGFISREIARPITELKIASERIARGVLGKTIKKTTNDEIGDLTDSYNKMSAELKTSRDKLEHHTQILEQAVRKRTSTLQHAKVELNKLVKKRTIALVLANKNLMNKTASLQELKEELEERNDELKSALKKMKLQNTELVRKTVELTKLHSELEDKNSALKEANRKNNALVKAKSEFMNRSAHDLRTPITPIMTLIPLIKMRIKDKKTLNDLEVIERNSHYLKELADDLISLIKSQHSVTEYQFRKSDFHKIITQVLDTNKSLFSKHNIKVHLKFPKSIPPIEMDVMRITEVVQNIVSNAIKFMPKKGELTVGVKKIDNYIKATFKDSGIGMSKRDLAKVFEEFYQADDSRRTQGSGLGLSICDEIIKKHGGRIWAESSGRGKGTSMIFTLPLRQRKKVK